MIEGEQSCIDCKGDLSLLHEKIFDTRFGVEGNFSLSRCKSCDLVQIRARPSPDELKHLYETYYNFGDVGDGKYTKIRSTFLASPLYLLWMALDGDLSFHSRIGQGRLLDVGCNEGRGLRIYQNNGFTVEGLEINERAASEARIDGFTVHTKPIEQFQPEEPYDVVVLSNVLEHSLSPKEMLTHIVRVLKPGGEVWISCPNVDSWQRSIFRGYWINWHVPFHVIHFSPDTLNNMLQESGFEIQETRQESPAQWAAYSLIARLFAKAGRPTKQMRKPLFVALLMLLIRALLFPVLWLGNRLKHGDCLVVIAKKV